MDTQYLKSQAILMRRQQLRDWKKKAGAGMKVRVTKCYLVQVLDDEENEEASEYIFCDTKADAQRRGNELKKEVQENREQTV